MRHRAEIEKIEYELEVLKEFQKCYKDPPKWDLPLVEHRILEAMSFDTVLPRYKVDTILRNYAIKPYKDDDAYDRAGYVAVCKIRKYLRESDQGFVLAAIIHGEKSFLRRPKVGAGNRVEGWILVKNEDIPIMDT